ncbi:hypothetical protein FRB91_001832 [Serendipita sp. 411]|nr:hypothetical protein FRC16_001790 [Serendipita sp. 398]KAG8845390.1 hypothetical protein FRB91_001832 [Serendipita sp. 411]KAG8850556.1 hypothetical protein FRC20_001988 [Serendipita sp. 405]
MSAITSPSSHSATPINSDRGPVFESLDPNSLTVDPENSVLVSMARLPTYLDSTLRALGLHTEARTSFITYAFILYYTNRCILLTWLVDVRYWLPDMHQYSHIALRFLPQVAYENSAPLNISPQPTGTTRVLMIWKGVRETDAVEDGRWKNAIDRFQMMPVVKWKQIFGVSETNLGEYGEGLRVLEWGGLQVL